jgi:hypothetical protein
MFIDLLWTEEEDQILLADNKYNIPVDEIKLKHLIHIKGLQRVKRRISVLKCDPVRFQNLLNI